MTIANADTQSNQAKTVYHVSGNNLRINEEIKGVINQEISQ